LDAQPRQAQPRYDWAGFRPGVSSAVCLPALVMAGSFVGYGAFLASLGIDLRAGLASNLLIWALPGQVVFMDMWAKGADVLVIALAVSLTAVRLLPMVVLVLSRARIAGAPRWPEFLVAHFTAVTMWIMANRQIEAIHAPRRLPWLLGLGMALMAGMFLFTALGFVLADWLPPALAAALVFFTPAFFFLSLVASARWRFDYLAIVLGAVIGPLATALVPDFDLLLAGLVGGTAAFVLARPRRRGLL
jgi:predicted branched-subunit amino acid permease